MRATLNDLDFHVEVEGSGPPLVLLHGFTGSARAWEEIRPGLSDVAQIIAIDVIGHGRSTAPREAARYSLEWCSRDLVALLDGLRLERADVLGYSMGGRVALHLAVTAPSRVSTLILESASPGIEDDAERGRRRASDDALAQRIIDNGVEAFVAEWENVPLLALQPHVPQAVRQRQHALRLQNTATGLANSLRGMGAGQQQPLWATLGDLVLPVHLLVGAQDPRYVSAAQRMSRLLPHSRLTVVEAAGHTVHVDQPDTFLACVRAALTNRVTPADFPMSTN